jgi:hypothetical protein
VLEALDEGLDGKALALGSVIAHILNVGVMRRRSVISALRELGVSEVEARDPIEWEREVASRA